MDQTPRRKSIRRKTYPNTLLAAIENKPCSPERELAQDLTTEAASTDGTDSSSVMQPVAGSSESAASEGALGERAITALEQWSRAVMAGEGTETSLTQVSLGQKLLDAMVLILRPQFPMRKMATA